MRPVTLQNPNLHKGPSSSKEFNSLRNDIQTDITTLFDVINTYDTIIPQNMDHVLRENFFLQNRMNKMASRIKELEQEKLNSNRTKEKVMNCSFYQAGNVSSINADKPVSLDTLHGYITPQPIKSVNKIYYKSSDGKHILPRNFEMCAYESSNIEPIDEETNKRKYYQLSNQDLTNVFDGDKNTFWVRHAAFDQSKCVTEVYGLIHFKIPQNITNNVYTNTIILHPSPEYSMSILDIQYKNTNGEWRRIETYPVKETEEGETPVEIKEASKTTFIFPRKEIEEVQIKVKQPYWFNHENQRIFMYGFQDIIVEYNEYTQDECEFVTKYSLVGTDNRFSSIGNPKVIVPDGCIKNVSGLIHHELYFDENLTEQFDFASEIYQPVQEVYIKTTVQTTADYVPVIKEIELPYRIDEF